MHYGSALCNIDICDEYLTDQYGAILDLCSKETISHMYKVNSKLSKTTAALGMS